MRICRECSVEHKIARSMGWTAIGVCHVCKERAILFDVKQAALEHAELIVESVEQRREDLAEHQAEIIKSLECKPPAMTDYISAQS